MPEKYIVIYEIFMKLNSFWKLPRKIVVYLDDQRPTFPSNSNHCIDLHKKSIDWFLCNGNINPYWLNNLITLITKIFFFHLKGIFNQRHTSVGHIREVGPETRDFLGNPRPETSLRYDPGTKTWDPKSATRDPFHRWDLGPETHDHKVGLNTFSIYGTRDSKTGTLNMNEFM